MKSTDIKYIILPFLVIILSCCHKPVTVYTSVGDDINIFPAYTGTHIPCNIAPLNFRIDTEGEKFTIRLVAGRDSFDISSGKNIDIPAGKWKKLLNGNKGNRLSMKFFVKKAGSWFKYRDMVFHIAEDPIDPYVAYRLIEPGYEIWDKMGLYQRCLENFEESPIMLNSLTNNNCMNCHSFCRHNPEMMLFHMRQQHAGTMMVKGDDIRKINTKTPGMISAGVYPRWHPDGRYVAFSTNITRQEFHTAHTNKIEVYDQASDIVIYDTETNTIFTDSLLHSRASFETFPEWSPDGRTLYFCSAPAAPMPYQYQSLRYDLLSIGFDPASGSFSDSVDSLVQSRETGKSVALGRISPDGNYLIFCMSDYGTFPIWHRENDLYLLNMADGVVSGMEPVNSDQSDSYHSWSSNGRWIIFSSRRIDGTFTRLFISYFDRNGQAYPPFPLPQKNPSFYDYFLKSYNIPELITGKVSVSPYELEEVARDKALEVKSR